MHDIDGKLAKWTELYAQLRDSRARLNEQLARPLGRAGRANAPEEIEKLRAEVGRLEPESEAALAALQAAFMAMKKDPKQH